MLIIITIQTLQTHKLSPSKPLTGDLPHSHILNTIKQMFNLYVFTEYQICSFLSIPFSLSTTYLKKIHLMIKTDHTIFFFFFFVNWKQKLKKGKPDNSVQTSLVQSQNLKCTHKKQSTISGWKCSEYHYSYV